MNNKTVLWSSRCQSILSIASKEGRKNKIGHFNQVIAVLTSKVLQKLVHTVVSAQGNHYRKSREGCLGSDELAPLMVVREAWLCNEPHPALLTLWVALLESIVITSIKISGTTCINKISRIWCKGWLISMFSISHFHKHSVHSSNVK